MTSKPSKRQVSLSKIVRDALREKKLTMPETEEEIAEAEEELKGETALPDSLQDRWGFLAGDRTLKLRPPAPVVNREVEQEFARAARSGKELTPEVLERMEQDRAAAEREAEKDEDE